MIKRIYSIDAPDQQRLKIARMEIEGVLLKHDLAGCVVLHTPGMTEFFYNIRPSYSCAWIDESVSALRVKSKLVDYHGDAVTQRNDQAATANMVAALADNLQHAAAMFADTKRLVDRALHAEHTAPVFTLDQNEAKLQ